MRQRLAPPFHLAESQIRREPERLYKVAANFVHLLFICKLPSPPRRRSVADRSAELAWSMGMLCPMVNEVEAIASSHLPPMNLFCELLPKCCHTHAPTHVTGPSCKLSNIPSRRPMMVLPILAGTSGNVAPRTHIKSHEVRLVWSTFAAAV